MKMAHCVTTIIKDYEEHVNDYKWMGIILSKLLVALKGMACNN